MKWSYGLTTVRKRIHDLLPRTLAVLRDAGFPEPRLFADGGIAEEWQRFGLPLTFRDAPLRTHGNWFLALHELYIREPTADRYVVFQDDFVTYRNLRAYLERTPYPKGGYCNLYTFPSNMPSSLRLQGKPAPGDKFVGWYPSNGFGRGAVALMFDRDAALELMSSRYMVERPLDPHRGWRKVDGGIVDALRGRVQEYVHSPSLVQHMGDVSTMGSQPHLRAPSFRGEGYDALELLAAGVAAHR